jgi:predicted transcriptional regulator
MHMHTEPKYAAPRLLRPLVWAADQGFSGVDLRVLLAIFSGAAGPTITSLAHAVVADRSSVRNAIRKLVGRSFVRQSGKALSMTRLGEGFVWSLAQRVEF